jgi:hypothetical protein
MWWLISACWAQDPHDRPSFVEVLRTLEELQAEHQLLSEQAAGKVPAPDEPEAVAIESPALSGRPASTAKQQPQSPPAAAEAQESSSSSSSSSSSTNADDARVAVVC